MTQPLAIAVTGKEAAYGVHVPTLEVRIWPEMINCRGQLIAKWTRVKNTLRALLRSGDC